MIVKPNRVTDSLAHNTSGIGPKGGKSSRSTAGKSKTVRPKAPKRKKGTKLHGP